MERKGVAKGGVTGREKGERFGCMKRQGRHRGYWTGPVLSNGEWEVE